MKFIFSLLLILSFVNADEMQRLDSIVKDIESLRLNYDLSQEQLKKCQVDLLDEQQKSALMSKELNNKNSNKKIENKYLTRINNLENQIKSLNNLLESKENEINRLKNRKQIISKTQIKNKCNLEKQTNEFPQLQMRKQEIKETGAATYRLKEDSIIYSAVNGKEIERWEKSRSFTSTLRIGEWIKISGYFVERQWQKAQQQMWVKASHAFKRE